MNILASVLAYFVCVGGIIGTFALSLYLVFAIPDNAALTAPAAALASTQATHVQTALIKTAQVKSPGATQKLAMTESNAASIGAIKQNAPAIRIGNPDQAKKAEPGTNAAGSQGAQKPVAPRPPQLAQLRRLIQEARARRWAYQQDFETRFLSFTD